MRTGDRDRVRPIGDLIRSLLKRKRFYEKNKYGALMDAWSELVGEAISERTRITGYRSGVLQVDVYSSVLLQELTGFLKHSLLEGLQATEAGRDIADIRFRLGSEEG